MSTFSGVEGGASNTWRWGLDEPTEVDKNLELEFYRNAFFGVLEYLDMYMRSGCVNCRVSAVMDILKGKIDE